MDPMDPLDPMGPTDELRVYLRDLTTNTWLNFAAGEWIDQYEDRIMDAMAVHAAALGGTLSMTGTPESGRVTVYEAVTAAVILDFDWHTMTLAEARGTDSTQVA